MMNNKVTRIIANSVGLAAVAALGITVYQLGTSPVKEKTPEEKTENVGESTQDTEEQLSEDAGTNHVESENQWISDDGEDLDDTKVTFQKQGMYGETAQNTVDNNESDNTADVDKTDNAVNSQQAEESSVNANMKSQTISEDQADEATDVSASALNLATVNFSEDTLMEWPVNGNVLLDYSMDQTTYFPTLDQYKLSPAIAVGAVEGAPVVAAVNGKVYSIEQNAQTGTTLTMELGNGYQAVYGQLTDLTVSEGDTIKKGTTIGYIAQPTKYYSTEGTNLYFAMKKDGEPIDPIEYFHNEIEEKNRVAVDRQPLIWYRAETVTYKQYFDICNRNDMCSIIQNM